jgi:hypothetical protein
MPDMSVRRNGCAALYLQGSVHVVGGSESSGINTGVDGESALKSAELYDTLMGQWRTLPEMRVGRNRCALVGLKGTCAWSADTMGGNPTVAQRHFAL